MRGIILNNINEFNLLHDRIHAARVKNGSTDKRWCDPIIHNDGRVAFTVEDQIVGYLTKPEADSVADLPDDWFPEVIL